MLSAIRYPLSTLYPLTTTCYVVRYPQHTRYRLSAILSATLLPATNCPLSAILSADSYLIHYRYLLSATRTLRAANNPLPSPLSTLHAPATDYPLAYPLPAHPLPTDRNLIHHRYPLSLSAVYPLPITRYRVRYYTLPATSYPLPYRHPHTTHYQLPATSSTTTTSR